MNGTVSSDLVQFGVVTSAVSGERNGRRNPSCEAVYRLFSVVCVVCVVIFQGRREEGTEGDSQGHIPTRDEPKKKLH